MSKSKFAPRRRAPSSRALPLPRAPRRGVSLIEALVALAVMAFGMLGVVGIQTTLRSNADLAKQRSQAVRIAQQTLEDWRTFSVLEPTAGQPDYAAVASIAATHLTDATYNTTYTRTGTVVESTPPGQKTLVVDVSWTDRSGATQSVRLSTLVAGIAPELAATLVTPPSGSPTRTAHGRHRGVPVVARDFGNGKSGYIPPQPGGVSVGWLFSNTTGWFTICATSVASNGALTSITDFSGCGTQPHLLLQGYVRYSTQTSYTPGPGPGAIDVEDANANGPVFTPRPALVVVQTAPVALAGTVSCFESVRAGTTFREYNCAMPIEPADPKWSGALAFVDPLPPLATSAGDASASRFRVCRYFAAPAYVNVGIPQLNQNYVVILAGDGSVPFTCPSSVTWNHQP